MRRFLGIFHTFAGLCCARSALWGREVRTAISKSLPHIGTLRRSQGSLKVPGVAYLRSYGYITPKGPLTHRLAVPPLPLGEGCDFDFYPSPLGRGGTARRWVRGLFHPPSDFDGTLCRWWTGDPFHWRLHDCLSQAYACRARPFQRSPKSVQRQREMRPTGALVRKTGLERCMRRRSVVYCRSANED